MDNKVLEQLKEEYNETLNRMQDLGDILAHCAEMDTSHCGLDATRLVAYGDNLDQLIGARVRLFHAPGHKCEECPYRVKSDGSACKYHKVELISGHYICLAKPEQDFTDCKERPTISFDEEQQEGLGDIMKRIREDTEVFMDYLDKVVINPQEQ